MDVTWKLPDAEQAPVRRISATYGDGTEIDPRDLDIIRAVCRDRELLFPWQAGDVMIIDNLLAMHGRKPYEWQRRVLVAVA